ncbi:DNA polymerase III subunit epsilon [Lysobacter arseniciresistens ZS79]|uniref:DNA polymerase III subunit epsilon n=1 Tax=Lysobacter arseniciresistens ZS79 TaxID=913325 RepID=A0A0A0F387_9GAMM|nr:vitamin K epoxide reductase family protein [Lysobacter arseniciresistens]KGM56793.1 DNA polymerase III subunit epsilon [Lysobacter arseniciresistens ZS79]
METRKPVVLVTGSSGFIGSAVIEKFTGHFDLVGLDRQTSPEPPAAAEFVGIDLTSDASIEAALARVRAAHGDRIASVIHLASYFDLTGEPSPKYEEVTLGGTERLLKALKAFDTEQFVFVSTMLVHAPTQPGQPIDEDAPLDTEPLPYRQSKIHTEQLLREQHGDIPVVLARPAGIYDDMGHSAFLAQQIARIFERQVASHVYPGSLETAQPSLHLDDLTDALLRIVQRRAELPAELPLLLAESEGLSVDEMQRTLGRLIHDEAWETKEIPKPVAKAGTWVQTDVLDEDLFIRPWMVDIADDHYEVDTSRAKQLLDWTPAHSLHETLPGIIAALKDDPVGWYRANKLNAARVATLAVEAKANEAGSQDDTGADATSDDSAAPHEMQKHMQGMRKMHFSMLWVHYLNIMLGAWLMSSPFVFGSFEASGFSDAVLRVTADRGLADPALRSAWLGRSDVISGLLIMLFGALSLSPRFSWAQWANAAVGVWLLFAPLVFWTPSAAVYANDTLVGALVIAFAILVPMMPGMGMAGMMDKSDVPPGWSYSPSTYLQRLPIIALGLFGLLLSRHLAAYQLGHIDTAWEPFFAGRAGLNGTEDIITSDVSKAWPVADAGLGAVTYMFEVLMGVMGDRRRWRTMPWMVAMFGFVVVPLGVVSIYFIIIQPIMLGTWCTLCLITALAMLIMIPYSLDELVAMGQYLVQDHHRGGRFWRTFFRGGAQPDGGRDDKPGFDAPLAAAYASAARGITVPWTLAVSALLGAALMFTRLLFDTRPPMADSDHLVGALIVTFAVMAMAEVGRTLRFVNVALGVWLVIAPWVLGGAGTTASWVGVAIGVAVIVLSLPRGTRSQEHYGSWDRFVV